MKSTNTKKDFHDTLKYGKFYVHIKKYIDTLCEAVTKLDGIYSIEYMAPGAIAGSHQLFIVNIYIPAWSNLPLYTSNSVDKSLDMTAHRFAASYFPSSICWNTTNCRTPGEVEYRISHWQ